MNKVLPVIMVILILGGGIFVWQKYWRKTQSTPTTTPTPQAQATIPPEILANKFGFLSGGPESALQIPEYGAGWIRPHPGPFLWDAMQKDANSEISSEATDKTVLDAQLAEVGTLATLWPFAEWDQKNHPQFSQCAVSVNDEFLSKNDEKGRMEYLPEHRCNPTDWEKYQNWVKAVVERYDGDGISDMEGLKIPIKYWEVMNEPDLGDTPEGRLDFYKEDANAYGALLVKTSSAIRQADTDAKILIAGAAGGSADFLDFYREVFKNPETHPAFDLGNVHCISNDENNDFNVSAYKKMLEEFSLSKPIWVTEAENMKGKTLEENGELARQSTEGAIATGAQRIFYTRYNFQDFRKDMAEKPEESPEALQASQQIYRSIFESIK